MLPHLKLVAVFFDDECNPDQANQETLSEFAHSEDRIGLGGMACSSVCESLSVITSSLFLSTLGFKCSERSLLSGVELFPDFIRMGQADCQHLLF